MLSAVCDNRVDPDACSVTYTNGEIIKADGNPETQSGGDCYAPELCRNCNQGFYASGPSCLGNNNSIFSIFYDYETFQVCHRICKLTIFHNRQQETITIILSALKQYHHEHVSRKDSCGIFHLGKHTLLFMKFHSFSEFTIIDLLTSLLIYIYISLNFAIWVKMTFNFIINSMLSKPIF